jgi:hypothetical protein
MDLDEVLAFIRSQGWVPKLSQTKTGSNIYAHQRRDVGNLYILPAMPYDDLIKLFDLQGKKQRNKAVPYKAYELLHAETHAQEHLATIERIQALAQLFGWRAYVYSRKRQRYLFIERTIFLGTTHRLEELAEESLVAQLAQGQPQKKQAMSDESAEATAAAIRAIVEKEGYRVYIMRKAIVVYKDQVLIYLGSLSRLAGKSALEVIALLGEKVEQARRRSIERRCFD